MWAKQKLKLVITIIITFFVIYLYASRIDSKDLLEVMGNLSWWWVAVGFLLFSLCQGLLSFRYKLFIHSRKDAFADLFGVQCLRAFLNYVLPGGIGIISHIYLLKKIYKIDVSEGAAVWVSGTFWDLVIFSAIALFAYPFLHRAIVQQSFRFAWVVWLFLLILCLMFFLLIFFGKEIIEWLNSLVSKYELHKLSVWKIIINKSTNFVGSLQYVYLNNNFFSIFFITLLGWVCMYLLFLATIYALGFSFSLWEILFLYLISVIAHAVPIRGIAHFGNHEFSWIVGLMLLGCAQEKIMLLSLGAHIILIFNRLFILIFPLCIFSKRYLKQN